jgi:hypothetical protein
VVVVVVPFERGETDVRRNGVEDERHLMVGFQVSAESGKRQVGISIDLGQLLDLEHTHRDEVCHPKWRGDGGEKHEEYCREVNEMLHRMHTDARPAAVTR